MLNKTAKRVAKIELKDLLLSDEIFDGDVSEKRQSRSVPICQADNHDSRRRETFT